MPWDNLIRAANKAKAKAKIQGSIYLNQQYRKGKQPLKMSLNARDNQATAPQSRAHPLPANQSKAFGGAQRERKRIRRRKRGYRKASPAKSQEDASETDASKVDANQAGEVQKKPKKKFQ